MKRLKKAQLLDLLISSIKLATAIIGVLGLFDRLFRFK